MTFIAAFLPLRTRLVSRLHLCDILKDSSCQSGNETRRLLVTCRITLLVYNRVFVEIFGIFFYVTHKK